MQEVNIEDKVIERKRKKILMKGEVKRKINKN